MSDRMFDSPVFVKSGNSLIEEIACLEDALEFLYEWPKNRRGTIYERLSARVNELLIATTP
ncbi:hypothetical protein ACHMW7_24080 [Aminobacter sp. UC22_36]